MQQSIANEVFSKIESDILSGIYQRGDTITENKLAERFNVSRTPVREAVKRLEQEDLVEYNGKVVTVLGISRQDVADVYEIRLKIEPDAVVRAAHNMNDADVEELGEIVDLQEFYLKHGNSEGVKDADSNFHLRIYELCGSEVYKNILSNLHKKIQRYRKISQTTGGRGEQSILEHRAIIQAIAQKDEKTICELSTQHILNAEKNILSLS